VTGGGNKGTDADRVIPLFISKMWIESLVCLVPSARDPVMNKTDFTFKESHSVKGRQATTK
jgi:hypothetical protein